MPNVCPLIFNPICKPKIWGGRNLERLFNKRLPTDQTIGETWECADLESGQSVVARGPVQGSTLHHLVDEWGSDLLGRAQPIDGRFPLLIKFLDAAQDLSIQVHPDPETAKRLGGHVRVKHEFWHVIDAAEGAVIYRGLKPGVTVARLAEAIKKDPAAIVAYLQRIPVKPGRTYYLPSGTLHALGAGVVVAEVQTPSDITYRLYDWGRVRPDSDAGLHVDEGLACILPDNDPAPFEKKSHVAGIFTTVTRCLRCPSFIIEKVRFIAGIEQEIPYAELVCWIVLEGRGQIRHAGGAETFRKGDVVILPAAIKNPILQTDEDCVWLEVTVPTESDLAAYPRPTAEQLNAPDGSPAAPMGINIERKRE